MKRFSRFRPVLAAGLLLVVTTVWTWAQVGGGFDLSWSTVDGGGNTASTSGQFSMGSTTGQPDAGSMSGGGFSWTGGFWARFQSTPTPSNTPTITLTPTNTSTPTITNTPTNTLTRTVTSTRTSTPTCVPGSLDYGITQTTGATVVPGITDTGNHCDDCITAITLPFSYDLYGTTYTTANVSSNGLLELNNTNTGGANSCLPNIFVLNSILAYWDDLRTDGTGVGVLTSVSGTAPNRIFNIEWRACISALLCTSPTMIFEVRLYERQAVFDIVYGMMAQTGTSATAGVEGSSVAQFAEYSCNTPDLSAGLKLTFTQVTCVQPTNTPTRTNTRTSTPVATNSGTNTPTNTATRTNTPVPTFTFTATITPTHTPGSANTPTSTLTPSGVIIGHVTWQGIAQPDSRNAGITATLSLCVGGSPQNYSVATDASGFFTATTGLANGSYNWRVKGQINLANAGSLIIAGGTANVEMGILAAGDCNNDNLVNVSDFNIMKITFGKSLGDPGYDGRSDFNRDNIINILDFNSLKTSFGRGGAALTCP
jgi:hypothetical protein